MKDDAPSATAPIDPPLRPRRETLLSCDLVMKGGITSGVVYPKAVVRVAREYQVRSVGGTSVGAIAASLVAAAEYERQRHEHPVTAWSDDLERALRLDLAGAPIDRDATPKLGPSGYGALYGIPAELGNNLLAKFQPQPRVGSLFHYVFSWMLKFETPVGKGVSAALLGLWLPRILTVLAGLLLFGGIRVLDPTGEGRFSLIAGTLITIAVIVAIRFLSQRMRWSLRVVVPIAVLASLVLARVIWSFLFGPSWRVFRGMDDTFSLTGAWDELLDSKTSVLVDVVPWVVVFWIAGAVLYLVRVAVNYLPHNDYGLCTGLGTDEAITNWMHATLSRVAGLGGTESGKAPVLTFGHLAARGESEAERAPTERAVRLEMIGTDIVRGVPLLLPNALTPEVDPVSGRLVNGYLFDVEVFERFFPPEVVRALLDGEERKPGRQYPFPPKGRIPVVVTARMSMSFPILFCAVPVIYCDSDGRRWTTWISDGGIVSNFPSNLFDESLPPWPTFGLDLLDADKDPEPRSAAVDPPLPYMYRWLQSSFPYRRSSAKGNLERLPTHDIETVGAFLMGAVNAARGWIDNSQKRLPGYAERIVAMNIYPGEGGLNLNMDRPRIEVLARRGLLGVHTLIDRWAPEDTESQWRYHRWVRMRTLMRELEEVGRGWREWFSHDPGALPDEIESFAAMATEMPDPSAPSGQEVPYPILSPDDQKRARDLITAFSAFAERCGRGTDGQGGVREAGEAAGASATEIVFNAPDSPAPNPKLLLMPPFE